MVTRQIQRSFLFLAPWLIPSAVILAAEPSTTTITLDTATGAFRFSATNGSLVAVTSAGSDQSIWKTGESGLWSARFADGSTLDAAVFDPTNRLASFSAKPGSPTNAWVLSYVSTALTVRVVATPRPDGVDLDAEVTPHLQTLLGFNIPGRLRFDPASVKRFVMPQSGGIGVGAAFNRKFFQRQPDEAPGGWRYVGAGPGGYRKLYGGPLVQREVNDPPVKLVLTEDGRRWLPPRVLPLISTTKAVVNRAPAKGQADVILVDSANGPYLSAACLGGKGSLWRVGGAVRDDEVRLVLEMIGAIVQKISDRPDGGRNQIGLVSLTNGPERGGWAALPVEDWRVCFEAIARRTRGRISFKELASPQAMLDATRDNRFACILNPYGEAIPTPAENAMPAVIDAIGEFVKAGGHWLEVGGHPFHQSLRPLPYISYSTEYPVAFSDFMHLETGAGCSAIYRIQPRKAPDPWHAANHHDAIFVPGSIGCGGDDKGGYCDHSFGTHVRPGQTWRAPAVRMTLGSQVRDDIARYAGANDINRPLTEKVRPEILARLRQSVLVYFAGSCREKIDNIGGLPVPTLIHFADYLRGGFDKEYPDHLPPNPKFGTAEEFRLLFEKARALGHLISPYTNPTWWCDHPRGPTFEREGEAPLLKTLDGKPRHEQYSKNDGWTITLWHPAVQRANRLTVHQFTKDYPVDILFQDQCGARTWYYDANPASPTPYAYSEGMISMVDEDSRTVPLGTENGWDRVLNYEALLCGMTWGIVPTEHRPSWVRQFKSTYPPDCWEIFPLVQFLAQDKAILLHHDLGQFITNDQTLSWSLGLGYSLSYRVAATGLGIDHHQEWLRWLDRIQKSVCARYIGQPLIRFKHDRGPLFADAKDPRLAQDDGVISAAYGDVAVSANLGPVPRRIDGKTLAPYGFHASSKGMTAAMLDGAGTGASLSKIAFVTEEAGPKTDLWIYAPSECSVSIPVRMGGRTRIAWDTAPEAIATVTGGSLNIELPPRPGKPRVHPPAELVDQAPIKWPGDKPSIGVIDLGPGISPSSTTRKPGEWIAALRASPLSKQHGVAIKPISDYGELATALRAGPPVWFAIINPYGEIFPTKGPGQWREALDAIHSYVNAGGSWWETAAYSFYRAAYRAGDTWKSEPVAASGAAALNIPVGDGGVGDPPQPLTVTRQGRAWLGDALATDVETRESAVNRGVLSTEAAPATVLVAGAENGFIGGYRLDGWGYLWRIGGFDPNPEVAIPVAIATTLHQYTNPPEKPGPAGTRYLWHATLTAAP